MSKHKPIVLAVCGLKREAGIAAGLGVATLACGGHAPTLKRRLDEHCERLQPIGLISFGIAGGLDPSLESGDIVLATSVVTTDATYTCDPAWRASLARALPRSVVGPIAAYDQPARTVEDKAALFARHRARAVDMESQHVARIAGELSLPFTVVRAIADPASRTLPNAALVGLRPDGSPAVLSVLFELAKAPGDLPALIDVARDSGRALDALLCCRPVLGPGLAFPDFGKLLLDMT